MAFVERINRTPRQRNRMIDSSVRAAVLEVKRITAAKAAERGALIQKAREAVEALPQSHFAGLAAKHSITEKAVKSMLLERASIQPELTITACTNTLAKLSLQDSNA